MTRLPNLFVLFLPEGIPEAVAYPVQRTGVNKDLHLHNIFFFLDVGIPSLARIVALLEGENETLQVQKPASGLQAGMTRHPK